MELLIDKVRRQPCLWDVNHELYRNVSKKDWIWERVAKETGMSSGNEAKAVWKKLRDSHREALRRRKNMKIAGAEMKPWKYEHAMRFLVSPAELAPEPENVTFFADDSNNEDLEEDIETIYETIESSPSPPPQPEVKYTPQKRMKRRLQKESPPQDSLSTLFESLHLKIRRLPKHLQLRVQREIFDSVLRAEEEMLSDPLGIRNSSPSSSTYAYGHSSHVLDSKDNILPSSSR